jgi:hypothetical protein
MIDRVQLGRRRSSLHQQLQSDPIKLWSPIILLALLMSTTAFFLEQKNHLHTRQGGSLNKKVAHIYGTPTPKPRRKPQQKIICGIYFELFIEMLRWRELVFIKYYYKKNYNYLIIQNWISVL